MYKPIQIHPQPPDPQTPPPKPTQRNSRLITITPQPPNHTQPLNPTPQKNSVSLYYGGAYLRLRVYTPREQALLPFMLPMEEVDQSKHLQCPMPGQLISLAVKEGDAVEAGQELAVVEAMKMQNMLRSPRRATIKRVRATVGASLKVDQVILDFAEEE